MKAEMMRISYTQRNLDHEIADATTHANAHKRLAELAEKSAAWSLSSRNLSVKAAHYSRRGMHFSIAAWIAFMCALLLQVL